MSSKSSSKSTSKSTSSSPSSKISKTPLVQLKKNKWCLSSSSSPTKASSSKSPSSGTSSSSRVSPEPNCAICLGKIEDKSFTDRCFHSFCRTCLFEWAKVKAECPVCRQAFEKIIFNVRSMDDYDEHVVETVRYPHVSPFVPYANLDGMQRFRYHSTLTPLRQRMMDFERRLLQIHEFAHRFQDEERVDLNRRFQEIIANRRVNSSTSDRPSFNFSEPHLARHSDSGRSRGQMIGGSVGHNYNYTPGMYSYDMDIYPPPVDTSDYRRYIYESGLYVLTNGDGDTSRVRDVSARFFASNPACTHRLIPWLNRELNAILSNPNETEILIPRIMNALLLYDITSSDFKKVIAPYTLERTDHFLHEFYNFARSPYDMENYTRIAVYVPRHRAQVVESEPLPAPIGFRVEPYSPLISSSSPDSCSSADSSPVHSIGSSILVLSDHSPLVCSVDATNSDVSTTEIRDLITPSPPATHPNLDAANESQTPVNPTPLPRGDLPDVNFGNIDIIEDFENPKPGTSGLNLRPITNTNRVESKWSDSDSTDIDVGQEFEAAIARLEQKESKQIEANQNDSDSNASSVLIVGYVKPLHERTPEFIDLISDSEANEDKKTIEHQSEVKKEKEERKKSKKRSHSRSSSVSNHSKKRSHHQHRHKSQERSKRHKKKYKHRSHRHRRYDHLSHNSSSSSSDDEMIPFRERFRRKHSHHKRERVDSKHYDRHHHHHRKSEGTESSHEHNRFSTPVLSTVSPRPASLGSVVFRKFPLFNEFPKLRSNVFSDTD